MYPMLCFLLLEGTLVPGESGSGVESAEGKEHKKNRGASPLRPNFADVTPTNTIRAAMCPERFLLAMSSLTQISAPAPEPSGKVQLSDAEKRQLMHDIEDAAASVRGLSSWYNRTHAGSPLTSDGRSIFKQRGQYLSDIRTKAKSIAPASTMEETYTAILRQFTYLDEGTKECIWLALYDTSADESGE
jgi:hypothetical protein